MITEDVHRDGKRNQRGLENQVQQNRGMDEDYRNRALDEQSRGNIANPVDSGGVESTQLDPRLEEQWLAVRDEYLAHYPDLDDDEIAHEKGDFYAVIERLAKKQQSTPENIQNEIMNWSSNERS